MNIIVESPIQWNTLLSILYSVSLFNTALLLIVVCLSGNVELLLNAEKLNNVESFDRAHYGTMFCAIFSSNMTP